jgi:hypothetical protein
LPGLLAGPQELGSHDRPLIVDLQAVPENRNRGGGPAGQAK